MSNRYSNFPDALDELKVLSEVQNMTIAQKQKASRCNELSLKGSLTTAEEDEFLRLVEELKGFDISSSDWNKVVETLMNTQRYIKDEMLGDIQRLADSTEAQIKGYADEAVIGVKGKAEELIASGQLGIDVLKDYVVLESPSDRVKIKILEYNSKRDILNVYINGALVQEGVAYNISSDGFTITSIGGTWDVGTVFNFHVTKKTLITLDYYDVGLIENGSITKEKLDEKYTKLLTEEIQESKDGRVGEIRYSPIKGVLGDNWLPCNKTPIELETYPKFERDLFKSGFVEAPKEQDLKRIDYGTLGFDGLLAYGNGVFVAVKKGTHSTETQSLKYSMDGKIWLEAKTTEVISTNPTSIVFSNGAFIITGYSDIIYSRDGVNWNKVSLPSSELPYDSIYGQGKWIVFTRERNLNTGSVYVSEDLVTWIKVATTSMYFRKVAYNGERFIGVGLLGAMYSTDLISWTYFSNYSPNGTGFIKYYDGVGFIIINGVSLLISEDGISWIIKTNIPYVTASTILDFVYFKGVIYIITSHYQSASTYLIFSKDLGSSYITPNNPYFVSNLDTNIYYTSLCIADNLLYLSDRSGYIFNVDEYSVVPLNIPYRVTDMINAENDIIVAVGVCNTVGYSYNGKDWIRGNIDNSSLNNFKGVCYDGTKYVALATSNSTSQIVVLVSDDGINWRIIDGVSGLITSVNNISYCNGIYLTTTTTGYIYYSSDLKIWNNTLLLPASSTASYYISRAISYNGSMYVLGTSYQTISSVNYAYAMLTKLKFASGIYIGKEVHYTEYVASSSSSFSGFNQYSLSQFSSHGDRAISISACSTSNRIYCLYTTDGGVTWNKKTVSATGTTSAGSNYNICLFNVEGSFMLMNPATSNTVNRRFLTSKDLETWTELIDVFSTPLVDNYFTKYILIKDNFVLFPRMEYYLELRSELPNLDEGYYIKAYEKEETQ